MFIPQHLLRDSLSETHQTLQPHSHYRLRVVLLALLGYAYIGFILLILLGLCILMVWGLIDLSRGNILFIKFLIPLIGLIWIVLKSLWVNIHAPDGYKLQPQDAPQLFKLIEDLRIQLKAPRFHRILINHAFNAGVIQLPRLGVLGWHRNDLVIGLPLLKLMTPLQLKAILAHEFAHLSGGHSRLSNWIYRLRFTWLCLLENLEKTNHAGIILFRPFLKWYIPHFNHYTYPLARANEYEADAQSAKLVSAKTTAETLCTFNVLSQYLDEHFWPDIHKQIRNTPEPLDNPFTDMGKSMDWEDTSSIQNWLKYALERPATLADTHPNLAERLHALGETPHIASPSSENSAETLLEPSLPAILNHFNEAWRNAISAIWKTHYQETQTKRTRLADLEHQIVTGKTLSLDEAYERAMLTETLDEQPNAAFEQFRTLHNTYPEHPALCFTLGKYLLARDDEQGIDLLTRAIENDENAILPGCQCLRDYYAKKGRHEEAIIWHERAQQRHTVLIEAQQERNQLLRSDSLELSGLSTEVLEALRKQLQTIQGLRTAYFVRKCTRHFPDQPIYILGFTDTAWWQFHSKRRTQRIREQLIHSDFFPGQTLIINLENNNSSFKRKFTDVKNAQLI